MDILLHILLFFGGVLGGFFGSNVGSAGLVSLPLLILMGLSPHAAVATSRPAAIVLELMSALRFWREGKLTPALIKRGIPLGLAGAIGGAIGARIIMLVSDQTLRLLFALVIATMSVFLFTKKHWGLQEHPSRQKHHFLIFMSTLLMGIYGGFFGFTFATLIMFVYVTFGYTLLQSAMISRVVGMITAIGATVVFASGNQIYFPHTLILAAGFGIGGWIGAGVGARKGSKYIQTLLFIVVVCAIAKLLWDYAGAV